MKQNRHFQVPENFFNQLEENILSQTVHAKKIDETVAAHSKVRRLWTSKPFMTAAAVILLVIGSFLIWNQQSAPQTVPENEQIAVETLYNTFFDSEYELAMDDWDNVYADYVLDSE